MEPHLWRAPSLGQVKQAGSIDYFELGTGQDVVFVHGWLANANLWRKVVAELAGSCRCILLDMPLGAHRRPMPRDADLTPPGCGALVRGALDDLGLERPLLVGNDSGGAYSQIAAAIDPERIAGLVLNACETPFDDFPPAPFDALPQVARDGQIGVLLQALRDPAVRLSEPAFGKLIKHPVAAEVFDSYALPCSSDAGVLADFEAVVAQTTPNAHHAAGRVLIEHGKLPVTLAWNVEDLVFPLAHAHRYADALASGTVAEIPDAYAFTPEDQPRHLAAAILRALPVRR